MRATIGRKPFSRFTALSASHRRKPGPRNGAQRRKGDRPPAFPAFSRRKSGPKLQSPTAP